jgi:hypothetical protein
MSLAIGLDPPSPEDDSPYLSMADFFSLISLTLIYVAMTLTFSGQKLNSEIAVLTGAFSGSGPASVVDARAAYITVVPEDRDVIVRLIRVSPSVNAEMRMEAGKVSVQTAVSWLKGHMKGVPEADKAVLYIDLRAAPSAHKLVNELTSALRKEIEVAVVFSDGE